MGNYFRLIFATSLITAITWGPICDRALNAQTPPIDRLVQDQPAQRPQGKRPAAPLKRPDATIGPDDKVDAFFEDAHEALDSALSYFDDSQSRPGKSDLPFYDIVSRTKESQRVKVEGYLDAAGEALGVSSISKRRLNIGELRETITENQRNLTTYKRKRISAPKSTYNPLVTTKSGYDKKIQEAEETILLAKEEIEEEKIRLVKDFARIGMQLSPNDVDELLDSITGDEFVRVTIVFDNAKRFAAELERLTNESGEDLEAAKKYYGIYLMLLNAMSQMQQRFVEDVDKTYYPKLDEFVEKAKQNMDEAEEAIRKGGDETVLRNNIESNQLTYDAALLYKGWVEGAATANDHRQCCL